VSNKPAGIYNRQFWLVCVSSTLFFASFNMLIPELPDFLESLDGADYKGLIISLFTLTAMISPLQRKACGYSRPHTGDGVWCSCLCGLQPYLSGADRVVRVLLAALRAWLFNRVHPNRPGSFPLGYYSSQPAR
jgi:hypothetical protein